MREREREREKAERKKEWIIRKRGTYEIITVRITEIRERNWLKRDRTKMTEEEGYTLKDKCTHTHTHTHTHNIYIYIYIYIEREREREREKDSMCVIDR